MPIRPEAYDRSLLSDAERQALAHYMIRGKLVARTREREAARRTLTRLAQPLQDVHLLLHPRIRQPSSHFWNLLRMLYREMQRREAAFWQWSREDWIAVLGASDHHFTQAHGTPMGTMGRGSCGSVRRSQMTGTQLSDFRDAPMASRTLLALLAICDASMDCRPWHASVSPGGTGTTGGAASTCCSTSLKGAVLTMP
jgi:hypothetical protein